MKISKIIITPSKIQLPEPSLKSIVNSLDAESEFICDITSTLTLNKWRKFYTLKRNSETVCWSELGEEAFIHGMKYDTIKIVFAIPKVPRTFGIGAFLIALKKHLPNPLILGSDNFGGVLFKDGLDLVHRMNKSAHFELKLLNLKTGEKKEFTELLSSKFETIIFEHTEFPLVLRIFDDTTDVFVLEGCEKTKLSEMAIKGGNFRQIADHYAISIKKFFTTNKNEFKHIGDVEIYQCLTLDNIYVLLHEDEIIFICTLTTFLQDDEISDKVKQLDSVWLDKNYEGKKIYSKMLWFIRSRLGIKRIVFGDQHSDDTYNLLKSGGLSAFTKAWYNTKTKEKKPFSPATIDNFYKGSDWKLILESNKIGDELTEEVKHLRFSFVTNPLLGYTSSLYDWQIK